jgi:mannonate dehydratase
MKLGLGLYRSMLTPENFRFARQAGATYIVAHLTDYFRTDDSLSTGTGSDAWGVTTNVGKYWTYEELSGLQAAAQAEGVTIEALENFDPAFWFDILLDGPRKAEQIAGIQTIIRSMGRAGIRVMGYYFSLAGVWGRIPLPTARGDALAVGYVEDRAPQQTPIPNGTVWNMVYDPGAPPGTIQVPTREELWRRLQDFLEAVLPVAEEAGVRLAAHPDDPPLPELRGTPRLIYQMQHLGKLLDLVPSRANTLELCLGTVAEMQGSDVYDVVERYSRSDQIGYIHFRNIRGKIPNYSEVFVDEGELDMVRILRILAKNRWDGVLIPDHTPQMACEAPWHAGMAYALGYMRGALQAIGEG